MHSLSPRHVHLDFHTSPAIPGIGKKFNKKNWQQTLLDAKVSAITLFAKCHHGWSYHPTKVGRQHPHLDFDLLRAQYDACKEVGIKAPIYLSAGVDDVAYMDHPEWRELTPEGCYGGWRSSPLKPGFHMMDFASPYLDYLCEQAVEVVRLFPDCDGIFSDIIFQSPCATKWTIDLMKKHGWDPTSDEDQHKAVKLRLQMYYRRFTEACRIDDPDMPVFHNSGHVARGRRDLFEYFSHMELESLPTGGWGYDHFPISARYVNRLPFDYMGMTGKFHSTWGEFGGFKHPNALRYECCAMIAQGAKCSVGDQLHPAGELDQSTYQLIGQAYREVAAKEAWCFDVVPVADIAVISSEAHGSGALRDNAPDIGAGRVMLESHFLFDLIDDQMDLAPYRLIVLPDDIVVSASMKKKLDRFVKKGGNLLLSGASGLDDKGQLMFDAGCQLEGVSEISPDYIVPAKDLRPDFVDSPMVVYAQNHRIKVTDGQSLGDVHDSYFNRTWEHFCSHQHAPHKPRKSGYALGSTKAGVTYLGHQVFTNYRAFGAVAYRHFLEKLIRHLLDQKPTVTTNMPSTARVVLNHQPQHQRHVLHLLHANTINRGGEVQLAGGTVSDLTRSFEVIEDLTPLRDVSVSVTLPRKTRKVTLEPQGVELDFQAQGKTVNCRIDEMTCHQMVVLHEQADGD